ncbi:MAG: OmpA family protein [Spirochaetales bacterium]|nr:OmpA family protein [Spirochaetales bacterium]
MKKRCILLLLFFLSFLQLLDAEFFKFIHVKGEKYRIISEVIQKVFINGEFSHNVEALNKVAVEVLEVKNNSGYISAIFQTSERYYGDTRSFSLSEELSAIYWRDIQGHYSINSNYFRPIFRDIPIFPEKDINPGDTWSALAEELYDFRRPFQIQKPYIVRFTVYYTYLGNIQIDGRKIAQFKIEYHIEHDIKGLIPAIENFYPVKILGETSQLYNWDIENGKVHSYEDAYHYIYVLSSGDYFEFIGTSKGETFAAPIMDKKKTVDEITEHIEKENLEGVTVEQEEKGVTITLEDIQFQPDSDVLLPAEKQKLQKIARILMKYPERDIQIEGHAAKLGSDEYLLELSKRRAKAVGDYLLSIGATEAQKMIIVGKGATEPIASNSTEAGRIKNRRVEITILEN